MTPETVLTIPSPLCMFQDCDRHGRCTVGPWTAYEGCRNAVIVCLRCGRFGELSERVDEHGASA